MVNNKVGYRDIINGINAGLCLLDRNFNILWMNSNEAHWVGEASKVCGKHCYNIFEHRNNICPGCPTLKVFQTGRVHSGNRIGFTKDGQKRYYHLTVSPITDGHKRVAYALELVQDITNKIKRKRNNSKIIDKLKATHEHLCAVNQKLRRNTQRLQNVTRRLSRLKVTLSNKYRKKINELMLAKREIQDIFRINNALNSSVDFDRTSSLIARSTCELIHTEACILRSLDEDKKKFVVNAVYYVGDDFSRRANAIKLEEYLNAKGAVIRKPLEIYDISRDFRFKYSALLKKEGLKSALCVPVLSDSKLLGVISAFSKELRHFTREEINLLCMFASQVAIAIQESKHCEDIHRNYFDTIHALVLALEARDTYTHGHTERVTKFALELARTLRMPKSEIEILRYAGEVHDVGKISIPDFILNKPGKLTPAERAVIELHPVKGAEMLEPLEFLRPALPIVRHHHERYDGTGYPDGLEKQKIPLMARILACADSFDAMTSDRPYRKRKFTTEEAIAEIRNNAGSQFDPHIANLFVQLIRSKAH